MIPRHTLRRAVAVPAALTLALGGALLGTTAAHAAVPADLVITTPSPEVPEDSFDVVVSGTVAAGATIAVAKGPAFVGDARAATVTGTTWTTTLTYAETDAPEQTVTVGGLLGDEEITPRSVTFMLAVEDDTTPEPDPGPTPQPIELPQVPVVTAPEEDEVVVGDRVTFQGIGTPGSDIGLLAQPATDPEQVGTLAQPDPQPEPADPLARIVVGADGTWSVTLEQLPGEYTVTTFAALLDESGQPVLDPATGLPVVSAQSAPVAYSVVAAVAPEPVPAPAPPVITAPVDGEVVIGDRVTVAGTGTPGNAIGLFVVPTANLSTEPAPDEDQVRPLAQPDPQPAPTDLAGQIIVEEDGTWSATLALVPNDYTAAAVQLLVDEEGQPVVDAVGLPIVSAPSIDVAFSLVAAVPLPAAPTPPVAVAPVRPAATALAYTGTETAGVALGLAGGLTLAGTALTLAARRRRELATVDAASGE